jgi:ribosome-binding protein aMBF1 (putative translation factor)
VTEVGKFTRLAIESKVSCIDGILGYLNDSEVADKETFKDLIKAVFGKFVALDQQVLADDLGFSRSSVHRWSHGEATPHPALFGVVATWVKEALVAKRDELKEQLAS